MSDLRILVVGGGVIGIATAHAILHKLQNIEVTIAAEEFTPDTTGMVFAKSMQFNNIFIALLTINVV